ncbi:GNAT family N-acetyltransferase [Sphingopyxis granuli]|uniref:GNAT family N-acetyltransferase n=1 Tax=Sphingopyxis granuli TaxID=267128 RepID=UPI0008322420|nr:GNAT family N-acetyltransferase [Sphingopyxis granuli]
MGSGGITAPARLAAAHELSDFTDGRHPSLDNWLRERVLVSEGVSARTYVVCDKERPQSVVGYYAISTAMEQRAVLPSAGLRRGQPDQVPLLLIGRLAVDASFQGTELGAALLADAMRRCLAAAEIAGVRAVAAHAIDDEAVGFYEHHGFLRSPLGDRVMLLPLEAARTLMPA